MLPTDRQTTDRQTDGRQHIANVDVSSRSLKTVHPSTFPCSMLDGFCFGFFSSFSSYRSVPRLSWSSASISGLYRDGLSHRPFFVVWTSSQMLQAMNGDHTYAWHGTVHCGDVTTYYKELDALLADCHKMYCTCILPATTTSPCDTKHTQYTVFRKKHPRVFSFITSSQINQFAQKNVSVYS